MSVINVNHNLIFIRVPRTASTSIGNVSFIGNGSHTTADDIRRIMYRNIIGLTYAEMFKFGFVRNPWDRLVAMCFYKKNYGAHAGDFVGRYENLQEDWEKVCQKLGMYEDLQYLNVGKHLPYKEYYTDESIEKVSELYKEDIEIFNYKFDM